MSYISTKASKKHLILPLFYYKQNADLICIRKYLPFDLWDMDIIIIPPDAINIKEILYNTPIRF